MRKIIFTVLKLLATISIIAFLIYRLGWSDIVNTVSGASFEWLAAGILVFLVSGWLGVIQWRLLLGNRGLNIPFVRAFKLYFVGLFFNNFIFGGIVGDAVKVSSIHSQDGRGLAGFAATFLDRFAGLWAMCGFAIVGSFVLLNQGMLTHGNITNASIALFAAFILFAGIMLFLIFKPLQNLFFSISDRLPLTRRFKLKEVVSEMLIDARDYRLLMSVSGLSVLIQFLRIGVHILTAAALGLLTVANFQYFFIFVPIIAMLMTIPLPFGVRETAGGALFALAGFPREAAFVMGFLASLIGIAASLLGGVFFVTGKVYRTGK
ncbi:MAG: flippase-like domain-containing protein [Chitinispirillales bacterium]|nr:flippase-like domain-containing protein [Chitinispirillales bacterium]